MHLFLKDKGDGARQEQIHQLEFMLVAKMNMGIAIPIVQIMTLVSFHHTFYFKNFR